MLAIAEVFSWGVIGLAVVAMWHGVIRWAREYRAFTKQLEAQGIVFPEPPVSLYLVFALLPLALILQSFIFVAWEGHWAALGLIPLWLAWLSRVLWRARRAYRKRQG